MLKLYSSGSNARGQLAQDNEEDSNIFRSCLFVDKGDRWPDGSRIVSIAAGANHTLVLVNSKGKNLLYGSGDGRRGQLGSKFSSSLVFNSISCGSFIDGELKQIAATWESSFVVVSYIDHDSLFSVGANDFGDLGVGVLPSQKKETNVWQQVTFGHLIPREAADMRISRIESGPRHIIVQLRYRIGHLGYDMIAGWGAARHGQIGSSIHTNSTKEQINNIESLPKKLAVKNLISSFAAGNQHTIFLSEGGTVTALGSNRKGQIENLDGNLEGITEVSATWNGSYLVKVDADNGNSWKILATGSNSHGQLGEPSAGDLSVGLREVQFSTKDQTRFKKLACGSEHVLALVEEHDRDQTAEGKFEVWGWGWNEHGNLGLGHTNDVSTPRNILPCVDVEGSIIDVWAGCATSWVAVHSSDG